MKCQKCDKLATFHITDLSGDQLLALHLCAECVKEYLQPEETPPTKKVVSNVISKQLKLEQTTEELAELDLWLKPQPACASACLRDRRGVRAGWRRWRRDVSRSSAALSGRPGDSHPTGAATAGAVVLPEGVSQP